jgi:hypothetical protein
LVTRRSKKCVTKFHTISLAKTFRKSDITGRFMKIIGVTGCHAINNFQ